ncbi:MAG: serine/threonine-protein kinase [Deltaproteobacteria bacterium]|nr:serine/threonine-protein kinase [Deltaproteobacteria bacterium]
MGAELWRRMWQVFEQAAELPTAERGAFLETACAGDWRMRQTVEELLNADAGGSLLDRSPYSSMDGPLVDGPPLGELSERRPEIDPPTSVEVPSPREEPLAHSLSATSGREPAEIGPYRLLRRLGQGGMGVVYLAQRNDDTFRRRVVIKLVRPGLEREDLLQRLKAERQILAGLDHPGIARLVDSGSTTEGLPYFVMEYVEGTPIDLFCDQNRLDIASRLRIFRKICEAVEYAHRNLVVHRDLKPSNIFVTAEGEPKLLDFGIAKLLNPELLAPDLEPTATWQRALTPSYASPEQLRGGPITTASDVYSLGVLLYKLLTGFLPFRFARRSPQEIERVLTGEPPRRPSSALTAASGFGAASETDSENGNDFPEGSSPETIAVARRSRPRELAKLLSGDLDAIVLKALRAPALERFGSVEGFSDDIGRYLDGQPVLARRGTRRYRAGRFLRRHRAAAVAVSALVICLALFAALMARQSSRLALERDQVRASRDAKENVLELMLEIFKVADPFAGDGAGESLTVREALDRSGPLLEQRLRQQPAQRAEILQATGMIYRNLGLVDLSRERLELALELRQALSEGAEPGVLGLERARTLSSLADVLLIQGRGQEALEMARRAVEQARDSNARASLEKTTQMVESLTGLVGVLCSAREYTEADPLAREALDLAQSLPESDPLRPVALLHMAAVHNGEQRYEEAVAVYRQALALQRAILGERNPSIATTLNNLGVALRRLDRMDEASEALQETLSIQQEHLGQEHPRVIATLNNLGGVAEARDQPEQARDYFQRALSLLLETSGPDHPRVLLLRTRILAARLRLGEPRAVEEELRQELAQWRGSLGADHRFVQRGESLLAETLIAQGRLSEAEGVHLDLLRRTDEQKRAALQERFSEVYRSWGYPDAAARFRPPSQSHSP